MLINIKANTIYNAFLLNSLVISLISVMAIYIKKFIDENLELLNTSKSILTFVITFLASLIVYFIMFFIFGFGGGMLTQQKKEKFW